MNKDVIYELLHNKAVDMPDAVAVFDEERSLTRKELDRLIDTIAAKIPSEAQRVGIMMEHTAEMIAAIFAVLKTGKTYVPVEPFFPQERIDFMMQDAEVDMILTNSIYKEKCLNFSAVFIDPGMKSEDVSTESSALPNDLAYILYTSGSTGMPKGVAVRNRNVCHYVRAFREEFHPDESDTMLQYSVCSFDIFVEEVFTTLLSGAVLAIPSAETKKEIHLLMEFVEKNHVTEISGFPYLLLEMNHLPHILDEHMNPVKPGEIGEICILGDGVSAGYVGKRKRENEAFVSRQDGSVIYRSGDLGYQLPDGNIAFLHRKDSQVMILGKRVEPLEVESVLCRCQEIEKAVVRPYQDEQNLSYMVAYIVLKQPQANLSTLKKEMARFLPNYMIPEFFVRMADLPLNANGKVDYKALPVIMKDGFVA